MAVEARCTRLAIIATLAVLTAIPNAAGQPCQNVQLSASITAMNFTSPNYPNSYQNSADCQWTITTTSYTAVVVLKVLDFYLENSTNCLSDYVKIYDGASSMAHTMRSMCGIVSSSQFTSTGNYLTVVFHSNWNINYRGFKFEYTSREMSALCGSGPLTAHGSATQLTSPGYPYNYPGIINCQWTITADVAQNFVVMNLLDFSLISLFPCVNDYVDIYDGSSTSSPRIDTLCGGYSTRQFISTGPSLTVFFHADSPRYLRGFAFEYTSKAKSDLCSNSILKAPSGEQFIISPGYPYNYTSDLQCQWTITADSYLYVIVLNFLDLYLEGSSASTCPYDVVTIYDGSTTYSTEIQKICGRASNILFKSTGPSVTITFRSDGSNNYKGFKLGYISKMQSAVCANSSMIATATAQYLTSLSYPFNYQNNIDCQWIITRISSLQVVVLEVLDFQLESTSSCTNDYVAIYDGFGKGSPIITTLCGVISNRQFASTGTSLTVVFHSNGATNYKGFKFQYTARDKTAVCSSSALTATSIQNYIYSPGYPSNYPSNSVCQWTITAFSSSQVVVLKFVDIAMDEVSSSCLFDYLIIYDGSSIYSSQLQRVCNSLAVTQLISSGPSMTVAFHSDSITNHRGFKLEYTSQAKSAACGSSSTLTASIFSSNLRSPNYPNYYPSNMNCEWHISTSSSRSYVVVLSLVSFSLEGYGSFCLNDYVKIFDGSSKFSNQITVLCGDHYSGRYESTGSDMTVVFYSDGGTNTHKGFSFTYQSEFRLEDDDVISTGPIIAIVICSIGVPCLVVAAIIIYRRRMAQSRLVGRVLVQGGGNTMPTMGYVVNPPQAAPYPGMQNPQVVTMGTVSYPPPTYSHTAPAGAVPPVEVPLLDNPK